MKTSLIPVNERSPVWGLGTPATVIGHPTVRTVSSLGSKRRVTSYSSITKTAVYTRASARGLRVYENEHAFTSALRSASASASHLRLRLYRVSCSRLLLLSTLTIEPTSITLATPHGQLLPRLSQDSWHLIQEPRAMSWTPASTVLDPSFGQDPSVGHFKFLTHFWLNYYQIKYMMSSTTS